jgi:cell division protein FtsI (penicillin-binding protein 3)
VDADKQQLQRLAKLLEMPVADLAKKLNDEDKTFVWVKRQVDDAVARQIAALNIKGIYQRKEYKREYPEGESAVHVVGFHQCRRQGPGRC